MAESAKWELLASEEDVRLAPGPRPGSVLVEFDRLLLAYGENQDDRCEVSPPRPVSRTIALAPGSAPALAEGLRKLADQSP